MNNKLNDDIVNDFLAIKANAQVVISSCEKAISKLQPPSRKNGGLTPDQIARLRAKAKRTIAKQIERGEKEREAQRQQKK